MQIVKCPYCGKTAELVDDEAIYGRSYGHKAYWCKPCDAYVGCHKGTDKPLGRLANAELRKWKMRAHAAFDLLWKGRFMRRWQAYAWLASELDIPSEKCHIGMMDIDMCQKVIDVTLNFLRKEHEAKVKSKCKRNKK